MDIIRLAKGEVSFKFLDCLLFSTEFNFRRAFAVEMLAFLPMFVRVGSSSCRRFPHLLSLSDTVALVAFSRCCFLFTKFSLLDEDAMGAVCVKAAILLVNWAT